MFNGQSLLNVGSVDGTPHYKNRTHPKQSDYYRGDKHRFFITAQTVVSPEAQLMQFVFGKGRNNDQAMFNKSGLRRNLILNNQKLLGDGGYHHRLLITPEPTKSKFWNQTQKDKRSIVEIVIGYVKTWGVARETFRQNIELQEMALWCVYQLAAWRLKNYPIRI